MRRAFLFALLIVCILLVSLSIHPVRPDSVNVVLKSAPMVDEEPSSAPQPAEQAPIDISLVAAATVMSPTDLHLSPRGSDANPGTEILPFLTLERARDEIRKMHLRSGSRSGGITVWLQGGTYFRRIAFELDSEDSGTASSPITYRAYPNETVRLVGGVILDPAWSMPVVASSPVWNQLDADARSHIRQVDLKKHGLSSFGTMEEWTRQSNGVSGMELFIGQKRMTLARWPDVGVSSGAGSGRNAVTVTGSVSPGVAGTYISFGILDGTDAYMRDGLVDGVQYYLKRLTWDNAGKTYTAWFLDATVDSVYPSGEPNWWYSYGQDFQTMKSGVGSAGTLNVRVSETVNNGFAIVRSTAGGNTVSYSGERPSRWKNATDIWFYGYWKYMYDSSHVRLGKIDTDTQTITLASKPSSGIAKGQPYFVQNLLEELTVSGEWYLDRSSGILYYWPPPGGEADEIAVSTLRDDMIHLNGVSYVNFDGLVMDMARKSMVVLAGCRQVVVSNCFIRNAGMQGIIVNGSDIRIDATEIAQVGDKGIELVGGDRASLTASGNVVVNCSIHDFAQWNWTGNPGIWLSGVGHTVANNRIYNAPHYGMMISGNNIVVEYNDIYNVCRYSSDAGAIYSGANWGYRGNVIRYNFIHDILSSFSGYGVHGIYLDDCVSGFNVFGNILYRVADSAIFLGGGRDHVIENNIIAYCGLGLHLDSRGVTRLNNKPEDPWNFLEKLREGGVRYQSDPWKTQYPALASIPNDWSVVGAAGSHWMLPENNVFNNNIGWKNGQWISESLVDGLHLLNKGLPRVTNLENADPLFLDAPNLDMTLKQGSPAFSLDNFQVIPFSSIGPKRISENPFLRLDGTQSGWALPYYRDAWLHNLAGAAIMTTAGKPITREEFASLLLVMYEKRSGRIVETKGNPFTDTKNVMILKAYALGIVKGVSQDRFQPENPITRQDAAVILKNTMVALYPALGSRTVQRAVFPDIGQVSAYALDALYFVSSYKVLVGSTSGLISPRSNVTREQAIKMCVVVFRNTEKVQ